VIPQPRTMAAGGLRWAVSNPAVGLSLDKPQDGNAAVNILEPALSSYATLGA
jgi:hypothetical protein